MRVAVIGGGVFGCTIAIDLARAGIGVDLYEARGDILDGATARNQARLHSGYHYPRSDSTAAATRDAAPQFAARYPEAIRRAVQHYVIADDSRVSGDDYLAFLNRLQLPYEIVEDPRVHHAQLTVRVPEAYVDVAYLRRLIRRDLAAAGVVVRYDNKQVDPDKFVHDVVVVATYGQPWIRPLRYEVCEVALVECGRYDNAGFVVLDGDYVSLDPQGRTHVLYDVVHTVHHANVGHEPEIPAAYRPLLQLPAVAKQTPLSNYELMLKSAGRHLGMLDPGGRGVAIYHGSLFSIRAVLPDVDATDERPTLVERHGDVLWVLSGKICTAVTASQTVVEMLT